MDTRGISPLLKIADLSPPEKWDDGWIQRVAQRRLLLSAAGKLDKITPSDSTRWLSINPMEK